MGRVGCFVVLLLLAGAPFGGPASASEAPEAAPDPDAVRALVRQLGDARFGRRAEAQRALIGMGPAVVPLLEKLRPGQDLEVQRRLDRVRRELVGYADDLRRFVAALPDPKNETRPAAPPELLHTVAAHQPRAGYFLLALLQDPNGELHRRATHAFVAAWDHMSAAQIDEYVRASLLLEARPRPQYPRGVDAAIGMAYYHPFGWAGWPSGYRFKIKTRTTRFLDGKPHGKPFAYEGPGAGVGAVRTGGLAPGKHTLAFEVEYEFTHRGEARKGKLRSKDFVFEMVPADTPDALVAPADKTTDEAVRTAFRIGETEDDLLDAPRPFFRTDGWPPADPWRPQVTWEGNGLHVPLWKLTRPLPVDLCFAVEIHDVKTGKVYPGDEIVVRKGETRYGYFTPRDVHAFAAGRTGFVPVRVVLKASRALALTYPEVTRYYPGEVRSGVLRAKIGPEAKAPPAK